MKSGRRLLAVFLAAVVLLVLLPGAPAAAATLEDSIAQQFDAFAATLNPEGTYDTAMRLVSHSIKGGGKLTMGQNDSFTAGLLHTELFRSSFLHSISTAVAHMLASGEERLHLRGSFGWYDHDFDYTNNSYDDNENGNDEDDPRTSAVHASMDPYTGPTNGYDDAMILVVGRSSSRITLERTEITDETVTFKVIMRVYDRFDFNGTDYSGDDDGLAELLTWLGRFLRLGGLLVSFDWSVSAELELTVPNPCTHTSGNYHWAFDGKQDLVSAVDTEFVHNPLLREAGTTSQGVFSGTVYTAEIPIRLYHDRPWSLEIRCAGTGMFAFSEQKYTSSGEIYLRKAANTVFFGQYVYLNEGDEKRTLTHYGVYFTKQAKISSADWHTYLLTNEVYEDGTNMIFLYIDGVSFGPMNQYYHVGTPQNATVDWVCGKDFVFRYVGNGSMPISDLSVEYIKAWENGLDNGCFSYCDSITVPPTCTESGYRSHTCALCGAVFRDSETPATGHSFGNWKVTREPTLHEAGEKTRSCASCGHVERVELPKLDPARGDATCDGAVDGRDLILLRQNLAGWDVDANTHGADCNGDGEVNGKDLILLRQYLAGWDVTLG